MQERTKAATPLLDVIEHGQSLWYDNIRRTLITSGELSRMIEEDGLRGVTSNPAIFEKAISGSRDYDDFLDQKGLARADAKAIYERLAIRDIQDAAILLMPVYERTGRRDGYVSLEVSPVLAHDTERSIEEGRRLWAAIDRPNAMIKIPATDEGIPAIQALISEGINVNVTLLFSQDAYERAADAYMAGLETRATAGGDPGTVASVASFFVSRIDTLVDARLTERAAAAGTDAERARIRSLLGKVAIANAKLAYQRYLALVRGERWRRLADRGAPTQRLLWASTSTKNPAFRDVYYVEELIGPDTVNTVPPATFDAFRDHGRVGDTLTSDLEDAHATMRTLAEVGVSMTEVTDALLVDAVRLFAEPFETLLAAIETRRRDATAKALNGMTFALPPDLQPAVSATMDEWEVGHKMRRLWARDASLWTGADESQWLGWLGITDCQAQRRGELAALAREVETGRFSHAVVLGMGGSSLCPDVLARAFGRVDGFPALLVLDSTDPAQVRALEQQIDLTRTLFIVSSKSGATLEPNIFKRYFFERTRLAVGDEEASSRFVAVTDPGSSLERVAEADGFRHVFHGMASIGGRYSALSDFGMVPAAIMGLDVARFLDRAEVMVHATASCVPVQEHPGAMLGIILGVAGRQGRDKVTLVASPGLHSFGAWLEQLLAESTGKQGKGLIPVDREPLGEPDAYGRDRLFVYLRLDSAPDAGQDRAIDAISRAGHPVVRLSIAGPYDLAQEFFRWEIATAVAGAVLGINPFDQPDVEASKNETRELTTEYARSGALPPDQSLLAIDGIRIYATESTTPVVAGSRSIADCLAAHFGTLAPGDYLAILAYVEMNQAHDQILQAIRTLVRDRRRVATCLGFGPRFLHSTGQAYKGGPPSGVFVQITHDVAEDLPVPGQRYTFGVVQAAQARGDFQVLGARGRRALRLHLGPDVAAGLTALKAATAQALA
ncbi:MAG: bifunctional transaldolase/phosoglucose isomerase [Acidobacteria bacterium]|nr:bifunctional transaldolase/phosoglucose isomerase [Acidobacteriota bacterium]